MERMQKMQFPFGKYIIYLTKYNPTSLKRLTSYGDQNNEESKNELAVIFVAKLVARIYFRIKNLNLYMISTKPKKKSNFG